MNYNDLKEIQIDTEYIKLDQLLKLTNLVRSGGEAKLFIAQNDIYVNGEKETRRGRKLRSGDIVSVNNEGYKII
jgi:ribosome-associated protein